MQELPVEKIKKQFDVLGGLQENPIVIEYIPPKIERKKIGYRNDVVQVGNGRSIKAQKYFNYCQQYIAFFKSRSYQFLFKDYSIGRIVYEFDDMNKIQSYNMYWNPCPFSREFLKEIEESGIDVSEYIDNVTEREKIEIDKIILRTPIRFDFISNYNGKNSKFHPSSHVHFQDSETRAKSCDIVSVYSYYLFVLENCYPEVFREDKYIDTIEQIRKLEQETVPWLKVGKPIEQKEVEMFIRTEIQMKNS